MINALSLRGNTLKDSTVSDCCITCYATVGEDMTKYYHSDKGFSKMIDGEYVKMINTIPENVVNVYKSVHGIMFWENVTEKATKYLLDGCLMYLTNIDDRYILRIPSYLHDNSENVISEEDRQAQLKSIKEFLEAYKNRSQNEDPITLFNQSKASSYCDFIKKSELGEEYVETE